MDFGEERDRMLRGIPGTTMRERLIVAMMTGAFDSLIADQQRKEREAEFLKFLTEL